MKSRTHTFAVTVTFDRACTAEQAIYQLRDTIHGQFFTDTHHPDPETFKVRFKRIRTPKPVLTFGDAFIKSSGVAVLHGDGSGTITRQDEDRIVGTKIPRRKS